MIRCPECGAIDKIEQVYHGPGTVEYEIHDGKLVEVSNSSSYEFSTWDPFACAACGEDFPEETQSILQGLVDQP